MTESSLEPQAAAGLRVCPADNRYQAVMADDLAGVIDFHDDGRTRVLTHTGVEAHFQGLGLAGQLVRFALDDIRQSGLRARPDCSYVCDWIQRHPEYQDLLV